MSLKKYKTLLDQVRSHPEYGVETAIVEFTEEIVRIMDERGVTRADLARRLQVSPAYVTKVLRGDANFTLETMVRISKVLGAKLEFHFAPEGAQTRWMDLLQSTPEQADHPSFNTQAEYFTGSAQGGQDADAPIAA